MLIRRHSGVEFEVRELGLDGGVSIQCCSRYSDRPPYLLLGQTGVNGGCLPDVVSGANRALMGKASEAQTLEFVRSHPPDFRSHPGAPNHER